MATDSKFRLKSDDNEIFDVEESVIRESHFLKNSLLGIETSNAGIPVPVNVSGKILTKVLEYCKYHADSRESSDGKPAVPEKEIQQCDAGFSTEVDIENILGDVLMAASYLDVPSLVDLISQTIADKINGKTTQELRDMFNNMQNDFIPEETGDVRARNRLWS